YQTVIDQIEGLMVPAQDFMIYLDFSKKIHEMKSLDVATQEAYLARCLTIIENDLYPAYSHMRLTVEKIMAQSTKNLGVCSWDNGHGYYEYLIHKETSYAMSAESLRKWATAERKNCVAEINALLKSNPELLSMNLTEVMPKYNSLEEVYAIEDKCLRDQFYDYKIARASEYIIPPYLEDYVAAGFYFPVSIDGYAYGNMYLQESAYTELDSSTLELYFHENIPGHHLYFSKFFNSDLPLIRKVSTWLPYEEGWAQYIQNISIDYFGLPEPLTKLLKASSKLSYYSMLLIDLNYHYDGISQEEALTAYTALGYSKTSAQKALNRMIAHPGEIIHYIYGGYKVESYLQQCQKALGSDFDIKAFHDMILNHAELPFTSMDPIVTAYIESQK
ncbi:MAG: DUF885 family protein, partial [Vallitaleaceae bacterium]|nr:DUF885 family protein [Vallitaleaceae bacterium]